MIDLLNQNIKVDIYTAVKRLTAKLQPQQKQEPPTIILANASDEAGYRCGATGNHSPSGQSRSCSKLVGLSIPHEFEPKEIIKVLA